MGFGARLWYARCMFVLVITGGLGAGKSTAAKFFRAQGATVLDLDRIAAELLAAGTPLVEQVARQFGRDVVRPDGTLDRSALAARAFSDMEAARRLNAVVHPEIAREVAGAIRDIRQQAEPPIAVVIEVPLLVEAPVFKEMADRVLSIAAPEEMRLARAVAHGRDPADAVQRIRAQASDEERRRLADDVIVNDAGEPEFLGKLAQYWDRCMLDQGSRW